jgi:hypothetical protein
VVGDSVAPRRLQPLEVEAACMVKSAIEIDEVLILLMVMEEMALLDEENKRVPHLPFHSRAGSPHNMGHDARLCEFVSCCYSVSW